MRSIATGAVVIMVAAMVCSGAYANPDPAKPFDETIVDPGSYDLTCELLDPTTYEYQWVLDYHGTMFPAGPEGEEFVTAFVVYDLPGVNYQQNGRQVSPFLQKRSCVLRSFFMGLELLFNKLLK